MTDYIDNRIPVKSISTQECPKKDSNWWLCLEPVVGQAICVIRCDADQVKELLRGLYGVVQLPSKERENGVSVSD